MTVRRATESDIDAIAAVYRSAKAYMDQTGNPTQWQKGYPSREMIQADIAGGQCYVITENEQIHAAFLFFIGEEKDYRVIDGAWRTDLPHGIIHRVASDGCLRGVFSCCLQFCKQRIANLRIDTHRDNTVMQQILQKNGFLPCGIVHLANGEERIGYQYTEPEDDCRQ